MKFIKYDKLYMEFKLFKSEVDYEYIFNNLDEDIKEDLNFLATVYYERLVEELKDLITLNLLIPNMKSIDDIPVKIYLFIVRDYKLLVESGSVTDYPKVKIGVNICLYLKDHYTDDATDSLQTLYFLNCDTSDQEIFKTYIYNLLFYTHIIMNNFSYHPLLTNIYHEEDIENFVEIKTAHIRLFGEFQQCSVCMENTISMTKCKHILCQRCACNLIKKVCPICRRSIVNEDNMEVQFYIT